MFRLAAAWRLPVIVLALSAALVHSSALAEHPAATAVFRGDAPELILDGVTLDSTGSLLPPELSVAAAPSPVILIAANGSRLPKLGDLKTSPTNQTTPKQLRADLRYGRPVPRRVTPNQLPKATPGAARPSVVGRLLALATNHPAGRTLVTAASVAEAAARDFPLYFEFEYEAAAPGDPFGAYGYQAWISPDRTTASISARLHGCGTNDVLSWLRSCPEPLEEQRIVLTRDSPYGSYNLNGFPVLSSRQVLQPDGSYHTEFTLEHSPEVLFPALGPYDATQSHGVAIRDYGHWGSVQAPWTAEPIVAVASSVDQDLFLAERPGTRGTARVVVYRENGELKLVPPGYYFDSRSQLLRPMDPSAPESPSIDWELVPDPEKWKSKPEFATDDEGREMREVVVWKSADGLRSAPFVPPEDMVWKASDGRIFERNGTNRTTLSETEPDPNATRMAGEDNEGGETASAGRGDEDPDDDDVPFSHPVLARNWLPKELRNSTRTTLKKPGQQDRKLDGTPAPPGYWAGDYHFSLEATPGAAFHKTVYLSEEDAARIVRTNELANEAGFRPHFLGVDQKGPANEEGLLPFEFTHELVDAASTEQYRWDELSFHPRAKELIPDLERIARWAVDHEVDVEDIQYRIGVDPDQPLGLVLYVMDRDEWVAEKEVNLNDLAYTIAMIRALDENELPTDLAGLSRKVLHRRGDPRHFDIDGAVVYDENTQIGDPDAAWDPSALEVSTSVAPDGTRLLHRTIARNVDTISDSKFSNLIEVYRTVGESPVGLDFYGVRPVEFDGRPALEFTFEHFGTGQPISIDDLSEGHRNQLEAHLDLLEGFADFASERDLAIPDPSFRFDERRGEIRIAGVELFSFGADDPDNYDLLGLVADLRGDYDDEDW